MALSQICKLISPHALNAALHLPGLITKQMVSLLCSHRMLGTREAAAALALVYMLFDCHGGVFNAEPPEIQRSLCSGLVFSPAREKFVFEMFVGQIYSHAIVQLFARGDFPRVANLYMLLQPLGPFVAAMVPITDVGTLNLFCLQSKKLVLSDLHSIENGNVQIEQHE